MGDDRDSEKRLRTLRRQAEKSVTGDGGDLPVISTEDTRKLIHELHTIQGELEGQNEELQRVGLSLESSKVKYQELYNFAPISYLTIDIKGMIIEVNFAAARLLGLDRQMLIGEGFHRFVAPEYHSLYYSCLSSATKSSGGRSCDLQLVKQNETISHVQMSVLTKSQEEQEAHQLWITLTDITDRKKTEDDLTKSEKETSSLLENMARGFVHFKVLVDGDGRPEDLIYLRVNSAFEKLTGLKRDDVLGRKITEVFPTIQEMEFDWIKNLGNVALSGKNSKFEQFFQPLNRWYSLSAHCPEPGFCAATFANITEFKKIEDNLKKLKDELEKRYRELEAFIHTSVHDLRTPLVSGHGFLQLLQRKISDKLDGDQQDLMEKVFTSFHRSDTLIRDLLEFSQFGLEQDRIEAVTVSSIIERIEKIEKELIKTTNASIRVQEDLPSVLLQEIRGYQLFRKLISNSLKFARENVPLEIEIGLSPEHSEEVPSNYRVFFVRDNGIGIDKEAKNRIFGPSAQDKIEHKGGSGLVVVKQIVDQENGKIWVETTMGKGTVFYISLPVLEAKER